MLAEVPASFKDAWFGRREALQAEPTPAPPALRRRTLGVLAVDASSLFDRVRWTPARAPRPPAMRSLPGRDKAAVPQLWLWIDEPSSAGGSQAELTWVRTDEGFEQVDRVWGMRQPLGTIDRRCLLLIDLPEGNQTQVIEVRPANGQGD